MWNLGGICECKEWHLIRLGWENATFPLWVVLVLIVVVVLSTSRSHERTAEELELVFEELVHLSALSHLSTSIKRELASIIVFEAHAAAGTVCKYIPSGGGTWTR